MPLHWVSTQQRKVWQAGKGLRVRRHSDIQDSCGKVQRPVRQVAEFKTRSPDWSGNVPLVLRLFTGI